MVNMGGFYETRLFVLESEGNNELNNISDDEVYRRFVDGVSQWRGTGNSPAIASSSLRYAFDLQRKRLESKGVVIDSAYKLRGGYLDNIGTAWSINDTGRYKSQIVFRSYENATDYRINNKTKLRKKRKPDTLSYDYKA